MSLFLLIISSLSLFLNLVEEEARPLCRHPRACPIGPAGEEGGPGGIQNLLKEEWKVQDGTEKKEDDDDQEEMEGKRRNEEKMQRSLVVVKFPLVPFATCLLPLELLLQGFFHQQEVKQPHRSDTQKTQQMHQITWHSCLPEQCNHCDQNFSRKSSLSKHMLVVHGGLSARVW